MNDVSFNWKIWQSKQGHDEHSLTFINSYEISVSQSCFGFGSLESQRIPFPSIKCLSPGIHTIMVATKQELIRDLEWASNRPKSLAA